MNMAKSARKAAKRYLEIKGYTILEDDFDDTGFIIAEDDNNMIAFIDVDYSFEMHDTLPNMKRDAFERMIFKYYKQQDTPLDKSIRYDTIDVIIVGEGRALIRHHIGADLED